MKRHATCFEERTMNKSETITDICDAAQIAWREAPASAKLVQFCWRGRAYVSTLTIFRMLIETADGHPVACRWL